MAAKPGARSVSYVCNMEISRSRYDFKADDLDCFWTGKCIGGTWGLQAGPGSILLWWGELFLCLYCVSIMILGVSLFRAHLCWLGVSSKDTSGGLWVAQGMSLVTLGLPVVFWSCLLIVPWYSIKTIYSFRTNVSLLFGSNRFKNIYYCRRSASRG